MDVAPASGDDPRRRAQCFAFIIIHPGSGAAVKLWRTDGWAFCADELIKALTTPSPVRMMLEEIASNMQSPAILVTDASVGQLAALQSKAMLVLRVDSGPLHLAVSQETPTIQLFGPTDPHIFGPWGKKERHMYWHQHTAVHHAPLFLVGTWISLHRK